MSLSENKPPGLETFSYSPSDYLLDISWDSSSNFKNNLSKFDQLLRRKWDEAMSHGHFRYDLTNLQTRLIPGRNNYIVQLNWQRLKERRTPEAIHSLQTPFNPERFNFTRVKSEEILFVLQPKQSSVSLMNGCDENNFTQEKETNRHLVLINVSPLEFGHVLIVPDAFSGLPQLLTSNGIRLSLDVLLLSAHPALRIGFNSLCALASVNHQHIHAWYLDYHMAIEDAGVRIVCENFHELADFPTRGFAFQLHGISIEKFCGIIYTVANFLQTNDIAHNFFMTRGSVFNSQPGDRNSTIRAYFWPRKSFTGAKSCIINEEDIPFNVAVAELAGHIPMYVPEKFDQLTDEYISNVLADVMLPEDEFNSIRDKIKHVLLSG